MSEWKPGDKPVAIPEAEKRALARKRKQAKEARFDDLTPLAYLLDAWRPIGDQPKEPPEGSKTERGCKIWPVEITVEIFSEWLADLKSGKKNPYCEGHFSACKRIMNASFWKTRKITEITVAKWPNGEVAYFDMRCDPINGGRGDKKHIIVFRVRTRVLDEHGKAQPAYFFDEMESISE